MSLKWLLLEFAKRGASRAVKIWMVVVVVGLVMAEVEGDTDTPI